MKIKMQESIKLSQRRTSILMAEETTLVGEKAAEAARKATYDYVKLMSSGVLIRLRKA